MMLRRLCCTLALLGSGLPADELPSPNRRGLYVMNADGSGVRRLLQEPTVGTNNCGSPNWSRDGSRIVFDATHDDAWEVGRIYVLHLTGDSAGQLHEVGPGVGPEWSPDGTQIAFYLHAGMLPGQPQGLCVMNADGTDLRKVSKGIHARWSPNGEFLLCTKAWGAPVGLQIVDLQTLEHWPVEVEGVEFLSKPSFGVESETAVVAARRGSKPCILVLDLTTRPTTIRQELPLPGKPITQVIRSPVDETCIGVRWRDPKDLRLMRVVPAAEGPQIEEIEPDLAACRSCDAAWSPDGKQIVFSSSRLGEAPPYFESLGTDDLPLLRRSKE
jgi:Tol biopolymer transport system component